MGSFLQFFKKKFKNHEFCSKTLEISPVVYTHCAEQLQKKIDKENNSEQHPLCHQETCNQRALKSRSHKCR